MNNLQIELGNLKLENLNLKYQLNILLEEKKERLNHDEEKIDYEQKILELKTKINELANKCEELIFQNEILVEEIDYQKQKFHTFVLPEKKVYSQIQQKDTLSILNTNPEKKLTYSELSSTIFDQSQRIVKLELEKQELTDQLKKYTKNQNQNQNSQSLEQQIKNLSLQLEGKEKENQKLVQQVKSLQQQAMHNSSINMSKPPLLSRVMDDQPPYQDYDVHASNFSRILIQK